MTNNDGRLIRPGTEKLREGMGSSFGWKKEKGKLKMEKGEGRRKIIIIISNRVWALGFGLW